MATLQRLDGMARAISRAAAIGGGGLILLAALTICLDVALRFFFLRSIGGADELSGYALGIAGAWGLSHTLLSRSHIRIDTVYVRCSRRVRVFLDLLGLIVFVVFMAYVAWRGLGVLTQSIISNTRSISALETPLVVPQTAWVAGLAWFVVVGLVLAVQATVAAIRGRPDTVFALIGSKAAVDEAEEELRGAKQAREQGGAGR